jgi:hypothetical protein
MLFAEHALATLRVGGFQYVDLGIVREQGTAPRSNDAMIINDQNAHLAFGPEHTRHSRCCTASGVTPEQSSEAIPAVDDHATRAMLRYASIR